MNTSCKIAFLLLIITLLMLYPWRLAHAQSSQTVNATVKLSICGNSVVEGDEDCEGSDLNGGTCTNQGYGGGNLDCDVACSYDTSSCTAPTPTASPTPAQTSSTTTDSDNSLIAEPSVEVEEPVIAPELSLPAALQFFDVKGLGRIFLSDLPVVVRLWVDEWRDTLQSELTGKTVSIGNRNCDINKDEKCDIKDFSLLMFYIER